ncbi:MAG: heparinase II/III family protein, partial [Armatimonadota bacterium]|nr:heparinase II/III family protein [Armatimonadota bacterium]
MFTFLASAGLGVSLLAATGTHILVSDFEGANLSKEWRFARCEVTLVPGAGPNGESALRVVSAFPPDNPTCWVRRIYPQPIDASTTRALVFRLRGDPRGVALTPHLLRLEQDARANVREVAFPGPTIDAGFEGWRQFQVPLDAFVDLGAADRRRLHVVNFSLTRRESPQAEVLLADIRLTDQPEGTIIGGAVPRVEDEAALYALLAPPSPDGGEIARLAAAGRVDEARSRFVAYLEARARPRYFVDWRTRAELMRALREHYPGTIEGHVRAANQALARDFTFEGDRRQVGRPVQWLQGPVEWTHILSRFGYWRSLGVAWAATGDEKYAREFVELLRDWVAHNPLPPRVTNSTGTRGNTWRTLEAGIRCEEWIRALFWFWDADSFTPEDKALLIRSLVEHARYLHAHELATGFQYGNWQVVECAGPAMVALLFPELREATQWRETAYRLLGEHLERDVHPDGAHHELTPGYHNWVAERLASVWLLAQKNDVPGPALPGNAGAEAFRAKLARMWEFNLAIIMPDGAMPAVGDAGRGSLRSQLALGALLFQRPDFRSQGAELPP